MYIIMYIYWYMLDGSRCSHLLLTYIIVARVTFEARKLRKVSSNWKDLPSFQCVHFQKCLKFCWGVCCTKGNKTPWDWAAFSLVALLTFLTLTMSKLSLCTSCGLFTDHSEIYLQMHIIALHEKVIESTCSYPTEWMIAWRDSQTVHLSSSVQSMRFQAVWGVHSWRALVGAFKEL